MDKLKIKWLGWFLEFINVDMATLPVGEKIKFAADIGSLMHGFSSFPQAEFEPSQIRESILQIIGPRALKRTNLEEFQRSLRDFFEILMEKIEEVIDSSTQGWQPEEKTDFFPPLKTLHTQMRIRVMTEGIPCEMETRGIGLKKGKFYKCEKDRLKKVPIKLIFETDTDETTLKFHLIRTLEGVPIGGIKKCPECNKWFLHLSMRGKIFCSNPCASRYGIRKKRKEEKEKNPEEYSKNLQAAAERSHQNYRKKIKTGKPERRPYKYKKSD